MSLRDKFEGNKFNEIEDEEMENCCPFCELVEDFTEIILDCESKDEVESFLHMLVEDVRVLAYKQVLLSDIQMKMDMIEDLDDEDYIYGDCQLNS